MSELWRPVLGHEGRYSVSSTGLVRRDAAGGGAVAGRVLVPTTTVHGYQRVELRNGLVRCARYVHRLVLEAFVGVCPEGLECRHLDGNPDNNDVGNLCWGTDQDQADDKIRHGRGAKKLDAAAVLAIRNDQRSSRTVARAFGVAASTIKRIRNGKLWAHTRRP